MKSVGRTIASHIFSTRYPVGFPLPTHHCMSSLCCSSSPLPRDVLYRPSLRNVTAFPSRECRACSLTAEQSHVSDESPRLRSDCRPAHRVRVHNGLPRHAQRGQRGRLVAHGRRHGSALRNRVCGLSAPQQNRHSSGAQGLCVGHRACAAAEHGHPTAHLEQAIRPAVLARRVEPSRLPTWWVVPACYMAF